jgi:hypothetical protein
MYKYTHIAQWLPQTFLSLISSYDTIYYLFVVHLRVRLHKKERHIFVCLFGFGWFLRQHTIGRQINVNLAWIAPYSMLSLHDSHLSCAPKLMIFQPTSQCFPADSRSRTYRRKEQLSCHSLISSKMYLTYAE